MTFLSIVCPYGYPDCHEPFNWDSFGIIMGIFFGITLVLCIIVWKFESQLTQIGKKMREHPFISALFLTIILFLMGLFMPSTILASTMV